MAPQQSPLEEILECPICRELLLEPVTLGCCGRTACRDCLRQLLLANANVGRARCPHGCGELVPFRLPPRSQLLQRCLEATAPEELERRRKEAEEERANEEALPGGFEPWEEVVASQDLEINHRIVVGFGTPGVVLSALEAADGRIDVIFDSRLDFQRGILRVMPFELKRQLPPHFGVEIGQVVVANKDLKHANGDLMVKLGVRGVARSFHSEDRVTILFERRADGSDLMVNAHYTEVEPFRKLLGGYEVGQRVMASKDLMCETRLMVHEGTPGVVLSEYSDARLTVQFDSRADGSRCGVNLTVGEIKPADPAT